MGHGRVLRRALACIDGRTVAVYETKEYREKFRLELSVLYEFKSSDYGKATLLIFKHIMSCGLVYRFKE